MNGNKVTEYAYDAFGNCTILSTTNSTIANANPFRYRGYYFDSETGFYYLNSRYYSPEWRRFISPDDTAYIDPETPNGLNLYCYCGNDPVNYCDPSGHKLEWWEKILIGATFILLGAVVTVATAGTGIGFAAAMGSALIVSLKATAISTAIGAGIGLTIGGLTTGTLEGAINGMLEGAVDSFMWGGIFAGGAQIMSGIFNAYAQTANHFGKLAQVKRSPLFSPDRLKDASEIAKIARKGQTFYDYGGTILRIGKFAHIDVSTKSLLHLAAFGYNHLPLGIVIAGILGGH